MKTTIPPLPKNGYDSPPPPESYCPGCGVLLRLGETCTICAAINRCFCELQERKGVGRFVVNSQPVERD